MYQAKNLTPFLTLFISSFQNSLLSKSPILTISIDALPSETKCLLVLTLGIDQTLSLGLQRIIWPAPWTMFRKEQPCHFIKTGLHFKRLIESRREIIAKCTAVACMIVSAFLCLVQEGAIPGRISGLPLS